MVDKGMINRYPRDFKLAAVKETLYHPKLPSFRRMDMDNAANKLPDEHCRTTTPCIRGDFRSATITLFKPPTRPLSCTGVTQTGRSLQGFRERNKDIGGAAPLRRLTENINVDVERRPDDEKLRDPLTGTYRMRYFSPSVTGSWRFVLGQEPMIDAKGQRPVPANIFSRYRAQSCRSGLTPVNPWRP